MDLEVGRTRLSGDCTVARQHRTSSYFGTLYERFFDVEGWGDWTLIFRIRQVDDGTIDVSVAKAIDEQRFQRRRVLERCPLDQLQAALEHVFDGDGKLYAEGRLEDECWGLHPPRLSEDCHELLAADLRIVTAEGYDSLQRAHEANPALFESFITGLKASQHDGVEVLDEEFDFGEYVMLDETPIEIEH